MCNGGNKKSKGFSRNTKNEVRLRCSPGRNRRKRGRRRRRKKLEFVCFWWQGPPHLL